MSQERERIERCSGRAIVIRGDDIDTDRIIPARYLRTLTFEGLEKFAFADARYQADGTPKDHPLNNPRFVGSSILVVNRNFGCGSSREHAPQALMRWGIRGIVGESFAEIFFGNCVAMGVAAVTAAHEHVAALMDSIELDPSQEVTVDLVSGTVCSRAGTVPIEIPEGPRAQLIEGRWDAMSELVSAGKRIRETAARIPYIQGF